MDQAVTITIGLVLSVVGWFIRRDIARFEKVAERQSDQLEKHAENLASIQTQMGRVVELGKWESNLDRFFGEDGGHARLWRAIEELQKGIENCRERDHWIVSKVTILKARTDKAKSKGENWELPKWKVEVK